MQTRPATATDYQCVDFDSSTSVPSPWSSQPGSGNTFGVTTAQFTSSPNSLGVRAGPDSGAYMSWSPGGPNLKSVSIAADVWLLDPGPGQWEEGHVELLCASIGTMKGCLSFAPAFQSTNFFLFFSDGQFNIDSCPITPLVLGSWSRAEISFDNTGLLTLRTNGSTAGTCQMSIGPTGSAAVFQAGVSLTPPMEGSMNFYVDNVVAWTRR